ncbi:MAG: hypothetical protein MJ025_04575 [Victivallaceae bacterium]|nr:hypothetical protein [Victivallaceae bacterium]
MDYPRGQYEGEDVPELLEFARAMTENRRYTRFDDSTLRYSGNVLRSKLVPAEEMERFEVVWTRATGCWNDRLFREEPATYDSVTNQVLGRLPENWTAAYLAAYGRSGLLYTSDVAVRGTGK